MAIFNCYVSSPEGTREVHVTMLWTYEKNFDVFPGLKSVTIRCSWGVGPEFQEFELHRTCTSRTIAVRTLVPDGFCKNCQWRVPGNPNIHWTRNRKSKPVMSCGNVVAGHLHQTDHRPSSILVDAGHSRALWLNIFAKLRSRRRMTICLLIGRVDVHWKMGRKVLFPSGSRGLCL